MRGCDPRFEPYLIQRDNAEVRKLEFKYSTIRLRFCQTFSIATAKTNYARNQFVVRVCTNYNKFYSINIFLPKASDVVNLNNAMIKIIFNIILFC